MPASGAGGIPEVQTIGIESPPGADGGPRHLSFRAAGSADAPALVLLHGIGSNSSGYRHQFDQLSRVAHVIAWDAPGYGASETLPNSAPSITDYTAALAGLLDALGIRTCVLVGSSLGALIAAAFAGGHPDRVSGLVLSAPATGYAMWPPNRRDEYVLERADLIRRLGPVGLSEQRAPLLLAPGASEEQVADARDLLAALRPISYLQAVRMEVTADVFDWLPSITAPVQVLCGDQDSITPLDECARPIHNALANSRLHVLPGAGHLLKIERPELFNAIVVEAVTTETRPEEETLAP